MKRKTTAVIKSSDKVVELKKHVAVIHSGSKLTLLQRKIANALLFNAYKDLLTKEEHEIHVSALCELIGYRSNDHKTIKQALVNLLSTVLQWNLVDGDRLDDEGIWSASSIIADASIDGPLCTYSYSNKMRKLLYRPNVYGRLDMLVQSKFQSSYGLALYENCSRFQDIGKTPWIDLQKFRQLMGITDGKYKIFRDLKSRVLDKAVEEVNKYSPIKIEPQYKKQKRQVAAIQFKIIRTNENIIGLPKSLDEQTDIMMILREKFGLSRKQIQTIISCYEINYIYEKIALIENSLSYKNGKILSLGKYLLSALSDDYQPTKTSFSKAPQDRRETEEDKQKRLELESDYLRYQRKELLRLFDAADEDIKTPILESFDKYVRKGLYVGIYEKEGIKNPLIQDQLVLFLKHTRIDNLGSVMDYAQWIIETPT